HPNPIPPEQPWVWHEGAPTADLVAFLRRHGKKGKPLSADLVEFMADLESASIEDVAEEVHDFRGTNFRRVTQNSRRTNPILEELGVPFRFKVSAGRLHKVSPGGDEKSDQ